MTTASEAYEKRGRAIKLAHTYLQKAVAWLHAELPQDPSYSSLLDDLLEAAHAVLRALPDDHFEDVRATGFFDGEPFTYNLSDDTMERIDKLVSAIHSRRGGVSRAARIRALENVEGRTPEEAATYLAKAAELRAKECA